MKIEYCKDCPLAVIRYSGNEHIICHHPEMPHKNDEHILGEPLGTGHEDYFVPLSPACPLRISSLHLELTTTAIEATKEIT